MEGTKLALWAQLIASLGVLAGLGVVIYELDQTRQLTYAQIFTDEMSVFDDKRLARMSEDPRAALFKASFCPDQLSALDVVTLDAYYESWVVSWFKVYRGTEISGLDRPWQQAIRSQVDMYFSEPLAQEWLEKKMSLESLYVPDEIRNEVLSALQDVTLPSQRQQLYASLLPESKNGCQYLVSDE